VSPVAPTEDESGEPEGTYISLITQFFTNHYCLNFLLNFENLFKIKPARAFKFGTLRICILRPKNKF
jgi:hypothetical protein